MAALHASRRKRLLDPPRFLPATRRHVLRMHFEVEIAHTILQKNHSLSSLIVRSDDSSLFARLVQSHHLAERCSLHRHSSTSIVLLCCTCTCQYLPHVGASTCHRSVHIQLTCTIQSRSSTVGKTLSRCCDVTFAVTKIFKSVVSNVQTKVSQLDFTWPDTNDPVILSRRRVLASAKHRPEILLDCLCLSGHFFCLHCSSNRLPCIYICRNCDMFRQSLD